MGAARGSTVRIRTVDDRGRLYTREPGDDIAVGERPVGRPVISHAMRHRP